LANGSSGAWSISIDESIKGKERWFAEIEGPSVYLSFQLIDLGILDKMIAFLGKRAPAGKHLRKTRSNETNAELAIGTFGQDPVTLTWDDEEGYEDRCFLVIAKSGCCMRLALFGEDTRMILEALHQIRAELS
jgi:hypothetical protein